MVVGFGRCTGSQSPTVGPQTFISYSLGYELKCRFHKLPQHFLSQIIMAWGQANHVTSAMERLLLSRAFPPSHLFAHIHAYLKVYLSIHTCKYRAHTILCTPTYM